MIPCVDRAVFKGDGTPQFEHLATATLMGWMPNFFMNSNFGKKKYMAVALNEVGHFVQVFSKTGDVYEKFAQIARRDGTSFT